MNNEQKNNTFDLVGSIIEYEKGELDTEGVINLFSHLVSTGMAWTLQGSYGRAAAGLINAGVIEQGTGRILKTAEDLEDEYA